MICARTCAMAFNRIVDRRFDAANPRTAMRHLPTGQISLASAWTLCLLSAVGLVAASWFLNPICFYLSPVALFFVCFYSLTKRFTDYTHLWLGVALALAPLGAWLAVTGGFSFNPPFGRQTALIPILLALIVVFWLVGFDIIYALQDYEFDRAHGLHSLAVAWGPKNALSAAFLAHMFMWGLLVLFGLLCRFRVAYFTGSIFILGCLMLEHWLARRRSLKVSCSLRSRWPRWRFRASESSAEACLLPVLALTLARNRNLILSLERTRGLRLGLGLRLRLRVRARVGLRTCGLIRSDE
jgi:4-hydroxybenzoate polyprenyltransferase